MGRDDPNRSESAERLFAAVLAHSLVRWSRAERTVRSAMSRAGHFLAGVVWASAEARTLGEVPARIQRGASTSSPLAGLYAWEETWFSRNLPPPSCHVFVGGAGRGREVVALQAAGYRVDAMEPSQAAAELRRHCQGRVYRGSHQDLARGAGPRPDARYDAVLLGWGSLPHVLGREEREALFARLGELCPTGPILASYVPYRRDRPRSRRAMRAGARVGRWAWGSRARPLPKTIEYTGHLGFLCAIDDEEVRALGRLIDREARIEPASYAHVAYHRAPSAHQGR